ncbi:hypothetical protein V8E51_019777 [Hyaloscypha variabilis]
MQFTKFAFIAATLLSATMASPTVSLNLRDDAADPLIGQGIVVSVNGSTSLPSLSLQLEPKREIESENEEQRLIRTPLVATLTPDQTLTCVKSDCGDLLLHSICVAAAVAIKDYKAVLKCFNLSTFDKVGLLFPWHPSFRLEWVSMLDGWLMVRSGVPMCRLFR